MKDTTVRDLADAAALINGVFWIACGFSQPSMARAIAAWLAGAFGLYVFVVRRSQAGGVP